MRSRTSPFAALAGAWLAAVLVVGLLVVEARSAAIEEAQHTTNILAHLLSEHTAKTIGAVGAALTHLGHDYEARPDLLPNDAGFRKLLDQRLENLPAARAIFVVAQDGFITHDTDYPSTPRLSLADRSYFQAHQVDPSLRLGVSQPLTSRTPALGTFVAVTWPLVRQREPDGLREFDGILVAALRPDYFHAFYGRLGLKSANLVRLHHRDGTLVAQYPANGDGADIGGGSRRYVVREQNVAELPLVVSVAQRADDALYGWRRSAWGAFVAMAGLTVLLGLFLLRLERERKQREAERRRRAQADKLEAVGQLTSGLAHDFGNFMQLIAMNVALLRSGGARPEERDSALLAMDRAVARSAALIKRLLAFARRETLQLGRHDLNALVSGMQELLKQAAGAQVEVVCAFSPALPPVVADGSQVETALLNLVLNARDAMQGPGRVVIRTYLCSPEEAPPYERKWMERHAGCVCLTIRDNGPGMPEAVRRRALEPFFSTKGELGTGLGLPQVYGFMQQIGGDLYLEATPGAGTAVTLIFPRAGGR